ncbi:EAL domain-containing protein [Pengzhenrongella sicca]|uniref:EAL domain-containing protein n=1 Tax=Pengzhenrongella sicca TaxID=2819238 RepID=A0A8A4ZB94_9MICO|nr:EAL domain-containing protein [Pengzhenrongella sicca]QTE28153.1 EAL domain-containing protein [Pengzhenrongella sicca]
MATLGISPTASSAVLEWVRDGAGNTTGGLLSDVCVPALLVAASIRAEDVDELFRGDAALRCVVLHGPDGPVLVDRSWFEMTITGRLGYGRLLHASTAVLDLISEPSLVLAHDCTVAAAASAVIARRVPGGAASAVVVQWPDGTLGVAHVSTLFEQLARQYAYQSWHDPLTMLPNRRYLMDQIRLMELQLASGGDSWQAVLFYIDLDRFKDINDLLGHSAGDQVLAQFAARLLSVSRAGDIVVRLGGDEFAILTAAPLTVAQSGAIAARLVLEAAAPFVVDVTDSTGTVQEHTVTIGASVGVAHSDPARPSVLVTSLEVLLKQADIAMYRAKEHGRGRAAHYDPQMRAGLETTETTTARRRMERRLRAAIEHGTLTVHYQPVVALPSGRVTGVEALARWHDPALGNVPPDQFIPLAEDTGLILDLGEWVLRAACREAARPAEGVDTGLTVAVNVSPVQLTQPGFVAVVLGALRDTGLAPHRLCLEITETAAISDLEVTASRLRELRSHGVGIALDDFGTGHSSLTMLRALPLTIVKIDRSFVENVARSAQDAVLVRMVIETAHTLGLEVCAEGIEDADQARQLVALGCDTAQGWYFGMPEPPSERLTQSLRATVGPDMFDAAGPAPVPLGATDELVLVTTAARLITYASSTSSALVGWTPQQLVGTYLLDHLHPESAAHLSALEPGAFHDGHATHRVQHRDGTDRWLDTRTKALREADGTIREVISVCRDVTATTHVQAALADSEEKFQCAFDDSPTGMVLSGLDGQIVRANPAFAAMIGHSPTQLVGRSIAELTHPDDLALDRANLRELTTGAATRHELTKRHNHRDGSQVTVNVRASVMRDRSGNRAYVIAHVTRATRNG